MLFTVFLQERGIRALDSSLDLALASVWQSLVRTSLSLPGSAGLYRPHHPPKPLSFDQKPLHPQFSFPSLFFLQPLRHLLRSSLRSSTTLPLVANW